LVALARFQQEPATGAVRDIAVTDEARAVADNKVVAVADLVQERPHEAAPAQDLGVTVVNDPPVPSLRRALGPGRARHDPHVVVPSTASAVGRACAAVVAVNVIH
jgi:hypothetical protein